MWTQYNVWTVLSPSEKAAWLQAVGSVLAVMAAATVPIIQRQNDLLERRQLQKARAKTAALTLLPAMERWLALLDEDLRDLRSMEGWGMVEIGPARIDLTNHLEWFEPIGDLGPRLIDMFIRAADIDHRSTKINAALRGDARWEDEGALEDSYKNQINHIDAMAIDLKDSICMLRLIAIHGHRMKPKPAPIVENIKTAVGHLFDWKRRSDQ